MTCPGVLWSAFPGRLSQNTHPWFHSALENSISRVPGMLNSSSFSWTLTIHTNMPKEMPFNKEYLSDLPRPGFFKCAFLQGMLHSVTVQFWTVSWKQLYSKTADLRPLKSQWFPIAAITLFSHRPWAADQEPACWAKCVSHLLQYLSTDWRLISWKDCIPRPHPAPFSLNLALKS